MKYEIKLSLKNYDLTNTQIQVLETSGGKAFIQMKIK